MSIANEIIKLGNQPEEEENAASDLWSWLPSAKKALEEHGEYYYEHKPSVADIMREAADVLAKHAGY